MSWSNNFVMCAQHANAAMQGGMFITSRQAQTWILVRIVYRIAAVQNVNPLHAISEQCFCQERTCPRSPSPAQSVRLSEDMQKSPLM